MVYSIRMYAWRANSLVCGELIVVVPSFTSFHSVILERHHRHRSQNGQRETQEQVIDLAPLGFV